MRSSLAEPSPDPSSPGFTRLEERRASGSLTRIESTAKALGPTVPPNLLALADDVTSNALHQRCAASPNSQDEPYLRDRCVG
jgi:hypothetical protein